MDLDDSSLSSLPDLPTFPENIGEMPNSCDVRSDPSWMAYITADATNGQLTAGITIPTVEAYNTQHLISMLSPTTVTVPREPEQKFYTQQTSADAAVSFGSITATHGDLMVETTATFAGISAASEGTHVSKHTAICRFFCRRCQRWGVDNVHRGLCPFDGCSAVAGSLFTESIDTASAARIPKVVIEAKIEIGDLAAVLQHGSTASIVKLNSAIADAAQCIGVLAPAATGKNDELMICMMGIAHVNVRGSVRPGDTIFADISDGIGVTYPPNSTVPLMIGRAVGTSTVDESEVAPVKVVVSPAQRSKMTSSSENTFSNTDRHIFASLMARVRVAFNQTLKSKLDNKEGVDLQKTIFAKSKVPESMDVLIGKITLDDAVVHDKFSYAENERILYKRLVVESELESFDETAVLFKPAAASWPLGVTEGLVRCSEPTGPEHSFVLHKTADFGYKLLCAAGDDQWLYGAPGDPLSITTDSEADGTHFELSPRGGGVFLRLAGEKGGVKIDDDGSARIVEAKDINNTLFTLFTRHCE